jgi:hypothetical protein
MHARRIRPNKQKMFCFEKKKAKSKNPKSNSNSNNIQKKILNKKK